MVSHRRTNQIPNERDDHDHHPCLRPAYLRDVDFGAEIIKHLHRIDATLAEHGGRFLVHGGTLTPLEGEWNGDLIVIVDGVAAGHQATDKLAELLT